jgi:hypothetical protein
VAKPRVAYSLSEVGNPCPEPIRISLTMDASFRPKSSPLGLLLRRLALPLLLVLSAVAVFVSLTHPRSHNPIFGAIFFGGFSLGLAGLVFYELRYFERHRLTIRGDHVSLCGAFRRTEIDLKEVTVVRWLPLIGVSLRGHSSKLVILFRDYERPEWEAVVLYLHSVIDAAVQIDWNLFAYQMALHAPKPPRTKAGPDEILVNRADWDRRLLPFGLPFVVVSGVIGVVAWRMTGDAKHLGVVIGGIAAPLVGWLVLRYQVPVEGEVHPKLSTILRTNRHARFMFNGCVLMLVGLLLIGLLWRFLRYPEFLLVSFMVLWGSFLVWETEKESRRKARQDRELADLAAKDRGEPRADTWVVE